MLGFLVIISLKENYLTAAAESTTAAAESTTAAAESTTIAAESTTAAVESTAAVSAVSDLQEARAKTEATARKRIDFFIMGFSLMFNN